MKDFEANRKVSEAKMGGFENRIERFMEVFEIGKRKISPFAAQKTIIDHTPYSSKNFFIARGQTIPYLMKYYASLAVIPEI